MRKYELKKSIVFTNRFKIDFNKDLDQAVNKLKSEIVLISEIKKGVKK